MGLVTGNYRRVAEINVFWRDLYRPELIWRSLGPVEPEPGGGIYVWRRTESGQAASRTSGTDGR